MSEKQDKSGKDEIASSWNRENVKGIQSFLVTGRLLSFQLLVMIQGETVSKPRSASENISRAIGENYEIWKIDRN